VSIGQRPLQLAATVNLTGVSAAAPIEVAAREITREFVPFDPALAVRRFPGAAVAAVAATVGVYEALHHASPSSTPIVAATSAPVPNADRRDAAAAPLRSLAVLPFEDGGAAEDAFFGQGVSDGLTSRLTSVAGVRVLPTSTAREYRTTTKAREQVARQLGVDYLLAGDMRWDRADAQRADWAIRHGEPTRGRAYAESARTILERRITADPGNARPRMLLAVAHI
jgi:hypothetical protein